MNKCLSFLVAFCFTLSVIAESEEKDKVTQTIRGKVFDKAMKTPIPGINVIVLGSEPLIGTATDTDGNFRFEGINIGRVSLRFSGVGYQEVVLSNLNLQSAKELVLNIPMEEAYITMEEIKVVAKADKTTPINKMATVSSRSFTVDETNRYAGSYGDVARMASNYAGVFGMDASRNDIIIRGNSPAGLLWRLDGVEIPNPNHWGASGTTGGPVSMLNNNVLDNSDFMTGAFPAEYGNALSGVFDLKMRYGNNEKYEFLGQIGFNGFEFGVEGPLKFSPEASFIANYRYSTLAVFEALGMDFGTVGVPQYQDLSFKIGFPRTKVGEISIFGLGGKNHIEIWESRLDTTGNSLNYYGPGGMDLTNGTYVGMIGLSNVYRFSSNLLSTFTVSANSQGDFLQVDTLTPVTIDKVRVYGRKSADHRIALSYFLTQKFSARNYLKVGVQLKTIAGETKDSTLHNGAFIPTNDFNGSTNTIQAFVQHFYRPLERWQFTYGIHSLYSKINNQVSVEPRFGVKTYLSDKASLSLGYGLHSQQPAIIYYFMMDTLGVINNPKLRFVKSHHFVLAFDYRLNEFTRIKLEPYYQYVFNAPVDAESSSSFSFLNMGASFYEYAPFRWKNTGTARNTGIELTFERFLNKGLYYLFTVSLFDSKYKGSDGKEYNTAFNNQYIVNALLGKEFVIASGEKLKTLALDIKTTYAGGKRTTPYQIVQIGPDSYERNYDYSRAFELKTKDYFKTDFKITFRVNGKRVAQEWALECTNLFNNKNIQQDKFNPRTGKVEDVYQPGLMIIPQWKILF